MVGPRLSSVYTWSRRLLDALQPSRGQGTNFRRHRLRLQIEQPAGWRSQGVRQLRLIQPARDFSRAELRQMGGHELGVQQAEPTQSQTGNQVHERDFGGVGDEAEHAFAEERTTQCDAVKPAYQRAIEPALHRMGMAEAVQFGEQALDLRD